MKDLDQIKLDNAKAVAVADGYRVKTTYHLLPDLHGDEDFGSEAEAWEAAALAVEERHKAEARYLDEEAETIVRTAKDAARTYSVLGKDLHTGFIFHDAVLAIDPRDAVAKVSVGRLDPNDDWEVIAVLQGDQIEDVTPSEFIS